MRRGVRWLALAALLASAPLWARGAPGAVAAAGTATTSQHAAASAASVASQRAEVQRLQGAVAKRESEHRAAAQRRARQDAEIVELRRQLQAVHEAGPAGGKRG